MSAPGQRYSRRLCLLKRLRKMATSGRSSHSSMTSIGEKEIPPFLEDGLSWGVYDAAHGMRCTYCMEAGKKNAFCDKLKKDALTKHATTIDHRAAIGARAGRKDMQQALVHAYKDQELAIVMAKKIYRMNIFPILSTFL